MKSLTLAAAALGLVLKVNGQVFPPDFTSMPSCAFTPLTNAVAASGCSQTDVTCFCGTSAFVNTITSEVSAGCSSADRTEAYRIITDLCSLNGVPINLGGSGGASTTTTAQTTTTAPPPPATTTTTTNPATTGAPSSTTNPATSGPPTTGINTTGVTTPPSQATSTGSASPPSTYTGGGPHVRPGWMFRSWQGAPRGGWTCGN
ncbi:hypothetical protein B0A52_00650 [Exophiala mesophila]|uniref:CFEM domain-containing protein n=1 Tax=Exophiala mesophila TaxID=212818 RepID=A0A438NHU4_EXOME|nr:hypothetical protein B0A52_00650 [Exophiala mesophila]